MKVVYRVDSNGYYIEDVRLHYDDIVPIDCIVVKPDTNNIPFYRLRWTGTEWVEDMSQEEIDELNNQPKKPSENDLLMLAVAELDMQREMDKTETQIAIAELATTILGGV